MSMMHVGQLAELTGLNRETVKKRVSDLKYEDGPRNSRLYDSREALPKIYLPEDSKVIDLNQARANLATRQTEKIELDMELRRGDYVVRSEVRDAIIAMLTAFRAKMLGLPTKAVPQLKVAKDGVEQEQIILELVHDALKELRDLDILDPGGAGPTGGMSGGSGATAKANRK